MRKLNDPSFSHAKTIILQKRYQLSSIKRRYVPYRAHNLCYLLETIAKG